MGTLVNYWRLVKPAPPEQLSAVLKMDNTDGPYGMGVNQTDATSWYTQIMKGVGSRTVRYKQFDLMDNDIDISRALDTIAEEVATENRQTNLPFDIEYQTEDNEEVNETIIVTVRTALRNWTNVFDLHNRIFRIARYLIKYGDCFFRRNSPLKRWEFIDPHNIIGIEVNQRGEKVAYHIGHQVQNGVFKHQETEIVPAEQMIHFSLSDDMGPSAPFGDSILIPVLRTYKQLAMLEDSSIIYRIVRAPERRVFYIDVGNMPAQRVKQYLEQVKNDIRQKRTPNISGPQDVVDGTYNPTSIQEDFFFPTTASGRGSRVETLPGGENVGELAELKYFQDKIFRGLRIPSSYMRGASDGGSQTNDGKVGIAYIEEQRFANFIKRLQNKLEVIFDREFKAYMNAASIKVDDELFLLKLPDPQNFTLYRQAAIDAELINTFNTAEGIKYLSRRFVLKRYLGFSEDDVQMNEIMLKQERGIREDLPISDLQQIYDPAVYDNRESIDVSKLEPEEQTEAGVADDIGDLDLSDGKEETEPGSEITPPETEEPTETTP